MNLKIKELLKLGILFGITGIIFWYLFKDIPWSEFVATLQEFDYKWVLFSMGLGFLSHLIRAYRWKLLLDTSGQNVWLWNSFFALMTGYLANSIVPRLGEVTRCGVVNRKESVNIPFAFGTVITERFIDLIMLIIVSVFTIAVQFNLLESYWQQFLTKSETSITTYWWVLALLMALGILTLWLWKSKRLNHFLIIQKIQALIDQGILGLRSVGKTKNPIGFWTSTLAIWCLYFFMLYVITLGSESTKDLGVLAGFSILVLGSFGMASPTPNGLGTFHAFVAGVLVLYGIEYDKGIIIATILHTSQFITILVLGSISLLLVNTLKKPLSDANEGENKG